MESGKLAVTCASTGAADPRMAQRQRHTAASCRSACCRVWSGRIMRNQKFARVDAHIKRRSQQACVPCTMGIRVNNVSCSRDFVCQLICNVFRCSDWCAQNSDSLALSGQRRIALPHHGVWFYQLGHPGELLNAIWDDSSPACSDGHQHAHNV